MTAEAKPEATQVAESPIEARTENLEELHKADVDEQQCKLAEDSVKKELAPVENNGSFSDEESNHLSHLKEHEKKALTELRANLEDAILQNKLFRKNEVLENDNDKEEQKEKVKDEANEDVKEEKEEEEEKKEVKENEKEEQKENEATNTEAKALEAVDEDISLWGVPLLPSKGSESTDVILLKFLRAREFKVKEAFEMLQKTLAWRKESKIDSILDEGSLGADLEAACYMDGVDREGHPVCYNVYGVFQDDDLYKKTFGSEEQRERFLRWRVQLMEEGIKRLDFKPGGVVSLLQITDLKNSPGPAKKELRTTMKQAVELLQDNYPELVARNILVNVPFWYYALHAILSPFLTQRTRSKFVFARPASVTETLLKYIPAEVIPVNYGGLKRENDTEFSVQDGVSELIVKSGSTQIIEIPAPEAGTTLLWDVTVLGWEVNYKEEFVPTDEGSYTIIVQKGKKMGSQEALVRNSFKNNEPGNVVLTIENTTFKRKKVLYRYKAKSS